jgi:hypothetical protein
LISERAIYFTGLGSRSIQRLIKPLKEDPGKPPVFQVLLVRRGRAASPKRYRQARIAKGEERLPSALPSAMAPLGLPVMVTTVSPIGLQT